MALMEALKGRKLNPTPIFHHTRPYTSSEMPGRRASLLNPFYRFQNNPTSLPELFLSNDQTWSKAHRIITKQEPVEHHTQFTRLVDDAFQHVKGLKLYSHHQPLVSNLLY